MNRKIILTIALFLLSSILTVAQTPTPTPNSIPMTMPAPTSVNLDTILNEAAKQTAFYQETFKNLIATETKTFERFDKDEEIKDQTVVKSIFLVYQSAKDAKRTFELRNVLKVDDKLIPDSQARAEKFLEELKKSDNTRMELEKIDKESSRYDPNIDFSGFTLKQGIVLEKNIRPVFEFKMLDSETIADGDAYVISYRQTKKSPFILVDEKNESGELSTIYSIDLPDALKKSDVFLRGKLWIDKQNFQIRREERELVAQPVAPIITFKTDFEYQSSNYGIFVPKKITFMVNRLRRGSKKDNFTATKDTIVTFDYTEFKKTDTDVRILDDN